MLQNQNHRFRKLATECLAGGVATGSITLVCFRFRLDPLIPACLYLISLILLSVRGSFVSSVVVSFAAVGCLDYFFIPPIFSITISDPSTILTLITFLATSTVIGRLVSSKQRLLQEKLERGEAYLSEAQRLSHTGSFGWKVATGEILWSEETCRIFQYDRTITPTVDLILQRVHPEDRDFVKRAIGNVPANAKDFNIEHRLRMPDGAVKHLHVVAHAQRDKSGKIEFIGAVMDVTVAKEAEDKIRLIINTVPGLLWTARPDGGVDFLNQRWLDYTGMTLEQGLGWAWQPGYHPDDLGNVLSKWRAAVAERKPLEVEARLRRSDGEYRWFLKRAFPLFDNAGRVLGWYGGNIDIHDLKQAEAALRRNETYLAEAFSKIKQSEASLRLIIDTIPALAWSIEADGSVEFVNRRWSNYTGLTIEQARGSGWLAAIHPEDVGWLSEQRRVIMASGKPYELEARMRRHDGQYRWFINRADPLLDEQGRIVKWYGTNTDIDDRKRTEEALRRAQAELTHVTRITTMGELTASIAHEVNQPLTAVVNNANACLSLLPNGAPHLEEVRDALTEIIDDADRASAIIIRVRQLAKKVPSERIYLDMKDVITEILALARYESVTRRVTIRTELPNELPRVSGDRVQLQQVLLNLVMNGMDAMSQVEEAQRVLIICGRRETQDGVSRVLVSVQDSGTGFKPEEMDRLFEAFYTTKPQGMGMGLAISRSIIETHGGRLWAETRRGPGATFLFSLPSAGSAAS